MTVSVAVSRSQACRHRKSTRPSLRFYNDFDDAVCIKNDHSDALLNDFEAAEVFLLESNVRIMLNDIR